MKKIYLLSFILGLFACSTPKNFTKISPLDSENITWEQGNKVITKTQDDIEVKINYLEHNDKEVVFDVDIYNSSDSEILIDPASFTIDFLSEKKFKTHNAVDPENKIDDLKISFLKREAKRKNQKVALVVGTVALASSAIVIAANNPAVGNNNNYFYDGCYYSRQPFRNYVARPGENETFNDPILHFWTYEVLRKTSLHSEEGIRGKVVFPVELLYPTIKINLPIANTKFDSNFKLINKIVKL
ncbi:MAG: hypothetical protein RLZZ546_82 [Bacteroidota bacterium]|jgi:hypothetical protein